MFEKIVHIIDSVFCKIGDIACSVWGWLLTAVLSICNFYGGFKMAFLSLMVAILVDMILGIWSAVKQGKYARSELARDTFSKVVVYGLALIVITHMEMLNGDTTFATNICASLMVGAELWSIAGNALIINPNLIFFKLLRSSLVGEIARKLHISEDDVKDAFENGENLIEKSKKENGESAE